MVGVVIAFNGSEGTKDVFEKSGGLAGEVGGEYVLGDGAHILALGVMNVDCAWCMFRCGEFNGSGWEDVEIRVHWIGVYVNQASEAWVGRCRGCGIQEALLLAGVEGAESSE